MSTSPIDISNLSADQIEALRAVLLHADSKRSENVFDLSKPPKQPYTHQEFPAMLYKDNGHVAVAKNAAEKEALTERGYTEKPHPGYDYSQIDRNTNKATPAAREEVTDEQIAAASSHQAKQIEEERKKNRRS